MIPFFDLLVIGWKLTGARVEIWVGAEAFYEEAKASGKDGEGAEVIGCKVVGKYIGWD